MDLSGQEGLRVSAEGVGGCELGLVHAVVRVHELVAVAQDHVDACGMVVRGEVW